YCAADSVGRALPTNIASAFAAYLLGDQLDPVAPPYIGPDGIAVPTFQAIPSLGEYVDRVQMGLTETPFYHICNCLWSLLFAALPAWLVGRMYDRRNSPARAMS